jgi:hypothetical protein
LQGWMANFTLQKTEMLMVNDDCPCHLLRNTLAKLLCMVRTGKKSYTQKVLLCPASWPGHR